MGLYSRTNQVSHVAKPKRGGSSSLLDPSLLGHSIWPNPNMLGLAAHQTHAYSASARGRTQVCLVQQLSKSKLTWSQLVIESKFVISDKLLGLCLFGLSAQLNSSLLGLVGRHVYVYLGSTHGQTQVCWVWQVARFKFIQNQNMIEPKYVDLSVDCLPIIGSFQNSFQAFSMSFKNTDSSAMFLLNNK